MPCRAFVSELFSSLAATVQQASSPAAFSPPLCFAFYALVLSVCRKPRLRHALPCKRLQPKAGRQTNFVCRPVAFLSARRCRSPAFCAAPFICPSVRLQAVIAPLGGAYCFLSIPGSFFQALSSADLRCLPAFLLLPSAPVRSAENRIFFAAPLPPCAPLCAAFPCIARGS